MAEKTLSSEDALALSGTQASGSAMAYPTIGQDPWAEAVYRMIYRLHEVAVLGNAFRVYEDDVDANTVGVRTGRAVIAGVELVFQGGTVSGLANNDVTLIWLYDDAGTATLGSAVDATGWPAGDHIKLAEVTMNADAITAIVDRRGEMLFRLIGEATNAEAGLVKQALADADSHTLIDNSAGVSGAGTLAVLTTPSDAPVDADALRDDLVANTLPSISNAHATLAESINELVTDLNHLRSKLRSAGVLATS